MRCARWATCNESAGSCESLAASSTHGISLLVFADQPGLSCCLSSPGVDEAATVRYLSSVAFPWRSAEARER